MAAGEADILIVVSFISYVVFCRFVLLNINTWKETHMKGSGGAPGNALVYCHNSMNNGKNKYSTGYFFVTATVAEHIAFCSCRLWRAKK